MVGGGSREGRLCLGGSPAWGWTLGHPATAVAHPIPRRLSVTLGEEPSTFALGSSLSTRPTCH